MIKCHRSVISLKSFFAVLQTRCLLSNEALDSSGSQINGNHWNRYCRSHDCKK